MTGLEGRIVALPGFDLEAGTGEATICRGDVVQGLTPMRHMDDMLVPFFFVS